MANAALKQGLIEEEEHKLVSTAETAIDDVVQVDQFEHRNYLNRK